jgi:hypothetical protein
MVSYRSLVEDLVDLDPELRLACHKIEGGSPRLDFIINRSKFPLSLLYAVLAYLLPSSSKRHKTVLEAAALRQQLAVSKRQSRPRVRASIRLSGLRLADCGLAGSTQ